MNVILLFSLNKNRFINFIALGDTFLHFVITLGFLIDSFSPFFGKLWRFDEYFEALKF